MSQLVGVATGRAQSPSGHHMAPSHKPELDPSLTSLLPSPRPLCQEIPKGRLLLLSGLLGERAAGTWTLTVVHAPPGSTQPSQPQAGEWR